MKSLVKFQVELLFLCLVMLEFLQCTFHINIIFRIRNRCEAWNKTGVTARKNLF